MKRSALAMVLLFGIAAIGLNDSDALGQVKKTDAKDTKKVETKDTKSDKKDGIGGIEIFKGKNGFRYRILDAEGKTVAMPLPQMAWDTKEDVMKALDALKETLNKGKTTESKD